MSESFEQWLSREMPAGTVIGDPLWWAPKMRKALQSGEPVGQVYFESSGAISVNWLNANKLAEDDLLYTTSQPVVQGFTYVDVVVVGYDGWINLFFEGEVLALVRPPISTQIKALLSAGKGGE